MTAQTRAEPAPNGQRLDVGAYADTRDASLALVTGPAWLGGAAGCGDCWGEPTNWSTGVVPGAASQVTIRAGAVSMPIVSGPALAGGLMIEAGAALLNAAREAFAQGLQLTAVIGAVVMAGLALLAVLMLRHIQPNAEAQSEQDGPALDGSLPEDTAGTPVFVPAVVPEQG